MARWNAEKREEVRQRILRNAKAIFEANGFSQTTMREIAAASEIATGTLFNYYDNKGELLFAALHADLEHVHQGCVQNMPPMEVPLAEVFVHVAGTYFDYYAHRPALSRTLLKESLFARGEAGRRFRTQVARAGELLIARVQSLQAQGQLTGDPQHIVLAFMSHYYFVLLLELDGDADPVRMRHLVRLLANQLFTGVGTSPQGGAM